MPPRRPLKAEAARRASLPPTVITVTRRSERTRGGIRAPADRAGRRRPGCRATVLSRCGGAGTLGGWTPTRPTIGRIRAPPQGSTLLGPAATRPPRQADWPTPTGGLPPRPSTSCRDCPHGGLTDLRGHRASSAAYCRHRPGVFGARLTGGRSPAWVPTRGLRRRGRPILGTLCVRRRAFEREERRRRRAEERLGWRCRRYRKLS